MPLLLDTGVLYALADRDDAWHGRARAYVERSHELAVEGLTTADLQRCRELVGDYPDIGFVDASVVAIAERLRLRRIATTDRRHFAQVRPRHVRAFDLVP
ncbi:MAG TPA: VapC toxin family PIN domain ribonuclease [Candidatus Binatia bacterium]|nr:VapC toxin family PIN domain ribonuclease [Candidatus Binatia bacterium]